MTPQELKNSILQLAIQGKLVEQRAEEGTGAELLEEILAAKNAEGAKGREIKLTRSRGVRGGSDDEGISNLSKAAKSHHGKLSASPREEIPDDEKPFDIPESWEWVRLGEVISLLSGRDLEPSKYSASPKKYPYMTGASNFDNGNLLVNRWTDCPVTISHSGDLLITCKGTVGAMAFNVVGDIHIARQIMAISSESVYLNYVKVFLEASVSSLKAAANSMIPGIDRKTMLLRPIPLPPLAEQKRIVAKIEELLPLVERYEKAWSKLNDFNKRFPADMQKSLLQMAIQGKLVEQRAEEGTGRELLEKILATKNAKSAKGREIKLTRSRGVRGGSEDEGISNLPKAAKFHHGKLSALSASPREEIPDDEKPFDIPESWEWVHINQVADTSLGKTMDKVKNTGDFCPYLCSINVYWDGVSLEKIKEARFTVEDKQKYLLKKGDLLICEGGDVGRSAIWNLDKEMYYQNALHRVRFYDGVIPQYFRFLIECYKWLGIIERYCKGVTIKHLVQKSLCAIYFPLPPLAEQKRIVAKLEELLPLCERLK